MIFTIVAFANWCNDYQIFISTDELLLKLDSNKIQELGNIIGNFEKLMEESITTSPNSLAHHYDPLGYSVWVYMQSAIKICLTKYLNLALASGVSITIAYLILTNKRLKNTVKFVLGYFLPMIIIPQILWLSYHYRFFGIFHAYINTPFIEYFYILYTAIFILMYIINYRIGLKMTKELNEIIEKK